MLNSLWSDWLFVIRSPTQAQYKPHFLGVKYPVTALLLARFSERASLEWWWKENWLKMTVTSHHVLLRSWKVRLLIFRWTLENLVNCELWTSHVQNTLIGLLYCVHFFLKIVTKFIEIKNSKVGVVAAWNNHFPY